MNRGYKLSRRAKRKVRKVAQVVMMSVSLLSGYVIGYADSSRDFTTVETVEVTPEIIEKASMKVENTSNEETSVTFRDVALTAGVATVLENIGNEYEYSYDLADVANNSTPNVVLNIDEDKPVADNKLIDAQIIRCTGYCDYGVTKSGEYVRDGIIAGKKEWLGRTCNLYRVNEDNSIGELIGSYEFLDTGYGIKTKTSNGVKGSLELGKSVDVWHSSEEAVWDWMEEYGDYVYIEFTS